MYLVAIDRWETTRNRGSLSRFTALRSLHLWRADDGNMIPNHPPLPTSLRCDAARSAARLQLVDLAGSPWCGSLIAPVTANQAYSNCETTQQQAAISRRRLKGAYGCVNAVHAQQHVRSCYFSQRRTSGTSVYNSWPCARLRLTCLQCKCYTKW